MVERKSLSLRQASASELIRALTALRDSARPSAIAFDADGTLWSGDVSEDVFGRAVAERLIREDAREALSAAAARFDLSTDGSPTEIAARIFGAYREHLFPERETCEMMTWCYAGWTFAELAEFARRSLQALGIGARLHRELEPVVDWARAEGIRTIVVSASPRTIVEEGAGLWQFSPADIAASDPEAAGERILPRMRGEVPYESAKCRAGERLIGEAEWLASFGDNLYDIDMMRAARLGVAVKPKLALRKLLPGLPFITLLA
jgi:phosphoserine phosphatase